MARRTTQPRELVRLSPLQFSLSISIVVILLGGAGLAGYYFGLKQAALTAAEATIAAVPGEGTGSDPQSEGSDAAVTFYSTLTEPRQSPPVSKPSEAAKPAVKTVEVKPAPLPVQVPGTGEPAEKGRSLLLQVASYKERGSADKLLKELSSDGYTGTVVRADLGERGVWFRVRVGPYVTGDADAVLTKLREERKLKGFIVK